MDAKACLELKAIVESFCFYFTMPHHHIAVGADPGVPRCAGPMKSKLSTSPYA